MSFNIKIQLNKYKYLKQYNLTYDKKIPNFVYIGQLIIKVIKC